MSKITGVVKEVTTPKSGITVYIYERVTGVLVSSTTSDEDGTFTFNGLDPQKTYTVTALSNNSSFNDAIDDNIVPSECDVDWDDVHLYLQFDGSDGGGIFTDSSDYNTAVTKVGTPTTSTTDPKIGTACGYFSSDNYLYLPDNTVTHLDSSNFTIEAWIKITSNLTSSYHVIMSQRASYSSLHNFTFLVNGFDLLGKLAFEFGSPSGGAPVVVLQDSVALSLNTWYHVAISRDGDTFRLFKNGVIVGSTTSSSAGFNSSALTYIGRLASGYTYYGYMDELRFTKGTARYTSDFSSDLQTKPYPTESCGGSLS